MIHRSIYISYEPGFEAHDPRVDELLGRLSTEGFLLTHIEKFAGYEQIELAIQAADLFLAVVDPVWTSSTWRVSELTFALGLTAVGSGTARIAARPVFVYNPDDTASPTLDTVAAQVASLPAEPSAASDAIVASTRIG